MVGCIVAASHALADRNGAGAARQWSTCAGSIRDPAHLRPSEDWLPIHRPQAMSRLLAEGLRKAGLPE
jgi:hypothetical protein